MLGTSRLLQPVPLPQPMLCAMPVAELPSQRYPQPFEQPFGLPFALPFTLPSSTEDLQEMHRREKDEMQRTWSSFFDR